MGLEHAFYILGIVFMSLILIILLALVAAVFVIRAKVVAIHKSIDEKLSFASDVLNTGSSVVKKVKRAVKKVH